MTLWLVVIGLGVSVVVAGVLWYRARDRRQIGLLLARVERLESAWETLASGPAGDVEGEPEGPTAPRPEALDVNVCGDALAGRTSHVRRLLDGSGPPLRSLGDQAILAIYEHIRESITPTDLATSLRVSLRTLERGLAQALACTPRQLILTIKMREARRLLAQGSRVVDVAQQLGFVNVFHFSRRFKSLYRLAPSQVRSAGGDL